MVKSEENQGRDCATATQVQEETNKLQKNEYESAISQAKTYSSEDQNEGVSKNSWLFALKIMHGAFTCFTIAYNMGVFNTLFDHVGYIYSWNEDEKLLNYSLLNSIPQAFAAFVSLFAGRLSAKFGRRKMLIFTFYLAILGNGITLIADTFALQFGRAIIGICFGFWCSIGPLYSIELACKKFKGASGITYSLFFGFGILLSFLLGYGLPSKPEDSATNGYWRLMLGLPIAFSVLSNALFHLVFTDETANYIYLEEKNPEKCKKALERIFVKKIAEEEFNDVVEFSKQGSTNSVGYKQLFGKQYIGRAIFIMLFTIAFNYVGCNAINIYSFQIIKNSEGADTAQLFTTLMPIGDLIGPIFAYLTIEKIGRKNLYINGLLGCTLVLLVFCITGWADFKPLQKYMILLYKLVFASSVAPVHWVYPGEILPAVGMGFFAFCYWASSLSTVEFLPYMIDSKGAESTIIVFVAVSAVLIVYLVFAMKETTGKGRELIEKMFYQGDEQVKIPNQTENTNQNQPIEA
ncbi:MFS transporter (macronuclear) [Tetrahymena thermophila SB210]|uniref:MFS transporter n=1 Tax=Tetrahymena thermophila (strain SB210) TaxID=312017 RepID=I7M3H8_TETTS|nr:MFS transporter [Tetrahymena thermophila SB210]EAS03176.2 MFS transporter [Tetrahymena thermophila SB210]|eukprot:XP_001023421.2 MFS transporter [Tetrahymena thermophila SB210]